MISQWNMVVYLTSLSSSYLANSQLLIAFALNCVISYFDGTTVLLELLAI